jgi:hypothetical protein
MGGKKAGTSQGSDAERAGGYCRRLSPRDALRGGLRRWREAVAVAACEWLLVWSVSRRETATVGNSLARIA